MATLNFSFAGESINAAKFESKVRKFELEFENPAYTELKNKTSFSVEYFFTINKYAENLSEAFHLAAKEAGVTIDHLSLSITGNLDSGWSKEVTRQGSPFNKIDVALAITSDATDETLEKVLRLAIELNPVESDIADAVHFQFSLNAVIHLN